MRRDTTGAPFALNTPRTTFPPHHHHHIRAGGLGKDAPPPPLPLPHRPLTYAHGLPTNCAFRQFGTTAPCLTPHHPPSPTYSALPGMHARGNTTRTTRTPPPPAARRATYTPTCLPAAYLAYLLPHGRTRRVGPAPDTRVPPLLSFFPPFCLLRGLYAAGFMPTPPTWSWFPPHALPGHLPYHSPRTCILP